MKISILFEALTGSFETDVKRASKATQKAAKDMEENFKRAGVAIGFALAAGVTAIAALTKNSIENAGALADMSQKVGISAAALSTLQYAASQSGVGLEQLQGGLVKLAKSAEAARFGVGPAADAFAALGISVKNADGSLKGTDDLFFEVSEAMAGFADGTNKTNLALAIFGKAGADLIPMLNEGREGLQAMQEQARALGLEISDETAQAAEKFGDQVETLGLLARGFGNQLMTAVLPMLSAFAGSMIDAGTEGNKFAEVTKNIQKAIAAAAIVWIKGTEAIQNIGATVAYVVDVLGTLVDVVKDSTLPLSTYFAALGAALSGDLSGAAEKYAEAMTQATAVGTAFGDSVRGAADALEGSYAANADLAASRIDALAEANLNLEAATEAATEAGKKDAPVMVDQAAAAAALAKVKDELAAKESAYLEMMARAGQEQADWVEKQQAAARALSATFKEREDDIENEIRLAGLSGAAHDRLRIKLQAENMARDASGNVIQKQALRYEEMLTRLAKADSLASILAGNESEWENITRRIEEVGQAIADNLDNPEALAGLKESMGHLNSEMIAFATNAVGMGISSLKSMAKEGTTAFKALAVAEAANNVVAAIGAILNQGKGDPYSAFARMAAMAAAVAQLVGTIGSFSGSFTDTAAQRQEIQGTGTVLGDWEAKSESIANATEITADATSKLVGISTGMLRALVNLRDAIGAATGRLARGSDEEFSELAAAASFSDTFSIGGGLAFRDPLNLLGGSRDITDQGILIVGNILEGVIVGAYREVQSRSWRFGSRRTTEEVVDVGDELQTQFEMIVGSIVDTVREGALALGLLPQEIEEAIAAFQVEEIRISLMDLSAEEQQAELEAVFSQIFDNLAADVVPFIEQFQQVGEGLGETLVRVATSVQVFEEAVGQLGLAVGEMNPEMLAQVAVGLVEAAGGIEQFIAGMRSFVDNFAPDAHRFAVAQSEIERAFAQVGLALPDTREGMWALMQSLDATTAAGQEQIATLLRLSGTADAYYTFLERNGETAARAAADQLAAAQDYADFVMGFREGGSGSEFQRSLRALREEFAAAVVQANDLARAAGLQGAREEDISLLRMRLLEREAAAIADLTASVLQQIADLYGTSTSVLEERIAAIDAEIEGLDRSDSSFGFLFNYLREQELRNTRAGLVEELAAAAAAEEAQRRQTQAMDLAQNLADLALARGVDFQTLAGELGLDLGRFGADLGLTAEGVADLIEELKLDSLTADVYSEGVDDIVEAIRALARLDTVKPWADTLPPEVDTPVSAKATAAIIEDREAQFELVELTREAVAEMRHLRALAPIEEAAERQAIATEGVATVARQEAVRRVGGENRIAPSRQPGIWNKPK